jgi:hypothetical protein
LWGEYPKESLADGRCEGGLPQGVSKVDLPCVMMENVLDYRELVGLVEEEVYLSLSGIGLPSLI